MGVNEQQTNAELDKHYERLWDAVVGGYESYRKYPNRPLHRKSTRANIVNDLIVARAIQEFDEIPETKPVEVRSAHLRLLSVGEHLLLWFKKMDRQRRCRIYPTRHARRLEAGQQELFPDASIVTVGYLLNREEVKVIRVSIAGPALHGKAPEWWIDIEPNENVLILPVGSATPGPKQGAGTPQRRIRITFSSQGRLLA